MGITLNNFEQVINTIILERGRDYYDSHRILELEEVESGKWSACVSGAELYDVSIERFPDGALLCYCDCPYDMGPYCKHVAAVLYAISDEYPKYAKDKEAKLIEKERPSREEKVKAVLNKLSKKELFSILTGLALDDDQLADHLIIRYSDTDGDKKTYRRMVRDALKRGKDRTGFVDYWGAGHAADGVNSILYRAEELIAQGKVHQSLPMLQAVIELLVPAIGRADDSNGLIGYCIDQAFNLLAQAAGALPPKESRVVFKYCLSEAVKEKYAGWDWCWDLAQLAANLISTPAERAKVIKILDRMAARRGDMEGSSIFGSYYDHERAEKIKLSIIEREGDEDARRAFLEAHVHFHSFREMLANFYIEHGETEKAKSICHDWLKNHQAEAPGYESTFLTILLDLAQQEENNTEIIRLAKALFFDRGRFEYYDLLKKNIPISEWPKYVEELLNDTKTQTRYTEVIPKIYVREQMWERLLAQAQRKHRYFIDEYREFLEPRFPDQVCSIYEKVVIEMLEHTSNRQIYQEACTYLRHMQRLGQEQRVSEIIQLMKSKYKIRRAMVEELNKLEIQ